ncbi:hypothetical protein B6D60_11750 [candidate division KSB1 bacterium 4484_87]|nr:MAG: hypothetical protein B6D60_11750 [candidate division KSB1 bacterium 4484_87]
MPTYDYRCKKCGHEFELFRSIMDESTVSCPECGTVADIIIGKGAGVIFHGSGFYLTDYSKKHNIS